MWGKVLAAIIAAGIIRVLVGLFVNGGFVFFGHGTLFQSKQPRQITVVEEVAATELGPGWQNVTVAVQPPPSPGEKVQVWIKPLNFHWYRCKPATQLASPGLWKATCPFGNTKPDTKDKDKAKPGEGEFSYGVFCSPYIGVDVLRNELPDINISWQRKLFKESQVEPIVMPAIYKGK